MAYRILLVDDEEPTRVTLAEVLEEAGYDVVEAASGDEACDLIGRNGFDLLLTDIQMPGQADGIDLARRFQSRHSGAPVVYMTGRPEMLARIGQLTPREAFLPKPFRPRQILEALHGLLQNAR